MPVKDVVHYSCDRCGRDWYEDKKVTTAACILRFAPSSGEKVEKSFEILCKGCEKTVANLVSNIVKVLQKVSPDDSEAKKEGEEPPSPRTKRPSRTELGTSSTERPEVATPPSGPSFPSKRP